MKVSSASSSAKPTKPDGLPPQSPDFIEQDSPEQIDNIVPSRGYQMTPMVGLGGSAGSIRPLTEFFKAMPADCGMVFVVIMHLSPTHESAMVELLGRSTSMKVVQAEDNQKVEPNHVYVIPPGKYLATTNGHLQLTDLHDDRGKRVAVDLFFRSLADTHGPHAAAVVLSGADGDGALGLRRVKERGGLTIAQDPDEAEHAGMPKASIATGMVDWVLNAADIPGRLLKYRDNEFRLKLPPEEAPPPAQRPRADDGEAALHDVLLFLRTRTGRDFACYKRATILRRIARRMQVNGVEDLPAYLSILRTHPGEAGALLQDMLISVTNFFRDRDAFQALEQRIPELFIDKSDSDAVRVWVPACATGEEAYSIAMLLLEHARKLDRPPPLQVFACDLDDHAIQIARAGHYPESITADVSEERLQKFFVKEHVGYRVRHELREMVLFAVHDLLKDAPFSRMDLISCRNLLIYLNREAQGRTFSTFHFALKPGGRLFLGASESLDDDTTLFRPLDKKHRIYEQVPGPRNGLPEPAGATALLRTMQAHATAPVPPVVHGKRFVLDSAVPFEGHLAPVLDRATLAALHFKLIERIGSPSVLINHDHEIVHLSESAGQFLQFVGGEPTTNLLRLVHPMLRVELRSAIFRASESKSLAEASRVRAEIDSQPCTVDIRVAPADDMAPGFLLVAFDRRPADACPAPQTEDAGPAKPDSVVRHLERELEQTKTRLRDTVEQYEGSTEELKASNEELQAMNEELRSATEELETSREELQSINEELTTVNQEMKGKVDELALANSDLQNLMASTSIATVFLDRELAIKRYTPSAVGIFHLIAGDAGRPLAHLKHDLDYPEMIDDAEQVLRTLVPIEREVRGGDRWYFARLQPYRTPEDHIAGVVLTFVDATERKHAEQSLADDLQAMTQLRSVGEQIIAEGDTEGLFDAIVAAAIALMRADAGTIQLLDPVTEELRLLASRGIPKKTAEHFARVDADSRSPGGIALAAGKRAIVDFDTDSADEIGRWHLEAGLHSAQSTPLVSRSGRPIGMLSTHWKAHHRPSERELHFLDLLARQAADAIERRQSDEARRASEERLKLVVESAKDYAIITIDDARRVTSWNAGAETMFGYRGFETIGQPADILFTPEDRQKGEPAREVQRARDQGRAESERWHARKDGSTFFGSGSVMPLRDRAGALHGFVKIMRDLTEQKRTQESLREHLDELTRFNTAAVGRELRMIELKKEINDLCARLGEAPRYTQDLAPANGRNPER